MNNKENHLINKIADEVGTPITITEYKNKTGNQNVEHIIKKYGSWKNFLEEFNVYSRQGWTKIKLKYILNEVNDSIEGKLSRNKYNENCKEYHPSVGPIYTKFDTWNKALKESNIEITQKYNQNWTERDCLRAIHEINNKVEGNLHHRTYNKKRITGEHPDSSTIYHKFGSWNNAKKAAGLKTIKSGGERESNKSECINAVQKVAEKIDGKLSLSKYDKHRKESYPTPKNIRTCFDSWNECKIKAGLEIYQSPEDREFTKEECIKAIEYVGKEVKFNISRKVYDEYKLKKHPCAGTIENKIETWSDAINQADINNTRPHRKPNGYWYGPNWKQIKKDIRIRDRYTCQNCLEKSNNKKFKDKNYTLDVHHIIPRRVFGYNYKKANDKTNLILLCSSCHAVFNNLPVKKQCKKIGINQPDVTPVDTSEFDENNEPFLYYANKAYKKTRTEDNNINRPLTPIEYENYAKEIERYPDVIEFLNEFSTWESMLHLAGIPPYIRIKTPKKCIEEIQKLADEKDGYCSYESFIELSNGIGKTSIYRNFGSWKNALKISGVYTNIKTTYSKSECVDALKTVGNKTENKLTQAKYLEYKNENHPSVSPIKRIFDSWESALKEADIDIPDKVKRAERKHNKLLYDKYHKKYTKSECIEYLNIVDSRIETELTQKLYNKHKDKNHPSISPIKRIFDSWESALKEADIDIPPSKKWTQQELIEILKQADEISKDYLTRKKYEQIRKNKKDWPSMGPFRREFGKWSNAINEADVYNPRKSAGYWTEEKIIESLKELDKKVEGPISQSIITNSGHEYPSTPTIKNKLGSLTEALKKSNLDYNNISREKYIKQDYIDALQKSSEKLNKNKFTVSEYNKIKNDNWPSTGAIKSNYGSWKNALFKASLINESDDILNIDKFKQDDIPSSPYTEQDCITSIRELSNKLGRSPTRPEYNKSGYAPSKTTVCRIMGSWTKAKRKAGVNTRSYTKEEMIESLRKVNNKIEGDFSKSIYAQYKDDEDASFSCIENNFDGWTQAKKEAGIKVIRQTNITVEDCLIAVRIVTNKFGRGITKQEYDENSKDIHPHSTTISKKIGSWSESIEKVGYTPKNRPASYYTKEKCIQALKEVSDEVTGSLTVKEYRNLKKEGHPSLSAIQHRFDGSFNKAKQEANLYVGKRQNSKN